MKTMQHRFSLFTVIVIVTAVALLMPVFFKIGQTCSAVAETAATGKPLKISDVRVEPSKFNPSAGDKVNISYSLSEPAKSRVLIFAPDMFPVRELIATEFEGAQRTNLEWDGRDFEGNIVPDQAWFVYVEAHDTSGTTTIYDPISKNCWHEEELAISTDSGKGVIAYDLPITAWVNLKVGVVRGGPLLSSIARWKPEERGKHRWEIALSDPFAARLLREREDVSVKGSYLKIPDDSILSEGNGRLSYFEYRAVHAGQEAREIKVLHPLDMSGRLPLRTLDIGAPSPLFNMKFLGEISRDSGGIPELSGKVSIRIALDGSIRKYVIGHRLEMLGFVDFGFAEENEEGYSPFTWVLDTAKWPDGRHVIAVNVVTLKGEVAAKSMVVKFANGKR